MASRKPRTAQPHEMARDWLSQIIDLVRTRTAHDFTLYKPGTLQRRIERRMAMASIEADDMARYLEILRGNATELGLLAQDLLINVTSFFRDRKVFDVLAAKIIPELVRTAQADQPLRIWVAGCSTGEETYSLAMLFREAITTSSATSNCRSSPPMSIRMRSQAPGKACIPRRSRRMCRPSDAPGSSRKKITVIECRRNCGRRWSSQYRTCSPIHHSPASTWCPAATC